MYRLIRWPDATQSQIEKLSILVRGDITISTHQVFDELELDRIRPRRWKTFALGKRSMPLVSDSMINGRLVLYNKVSEWVSIPQGCYRSFSLTMYCAARKSKACCESTCIIEIKRTAISSSQSIGQRDSGAMQAASNGSSRIQCHRIHLP